MDESLVLVTVVDGVLEEDDPGCNCCCCTGECSSYGYELEDALSLGMVEGDYD